MSQAAIRQSLEPIFLNFAVIERNCSHFYLSIGESNQTPKARHAVLGEQTDPQAEGEK